MVDALRSGRSILTDVWVRLPPSAPILKTLRLIPTGRLKINALRASSSMPNGARVPCRSPISCQTPASKTARVIGLKTSPRQIGNALRGIVTGLTEQQRRQ